MNNNFMNNNILAEDSRGFSHVAVDAGLLAKRKLFLTEGVNDETSCMLIQQMMYLDSENSEDEITLYINSPGGMVSSGLAVYDAMRLIRAPVRTVCIGTAASMGAILFLAGDDREMLPHSKIMVHDPSYGGGNYAGKKPHEIQKEVDELNKTREVICKIIAERTARPIEEIYEKTRTDCYFNAAEALNFGLATAVSKELR